MYRNRILLLLMMMIVMASGLRAQTNNLHFFVKQNDFENVRHYISRHEDVNAYDDDGYTPLMYAADNGNLDIIKVLMDNGAQPNTVALYDHEPPALHATVLLNNPASLNLLLSYEVTKVDFRDSLGYTALYYALRDGYLECADILLCHNANPNVEFPNNVTPLQIVASLNDTAMINLLLDFGANVNTVSNGKTAFSVAVEYGATQAAALLAGEGADINVGYPLHYAAIYADTATLGLLYRLGMDFNSHGADPALPRDLAIANSKTMNAKYIASKGGLLDKKLMFNYVSVSAFQEYWKREYRLGFQLGVQELRSNVMLYASASIRPMYKPAFIQERPHLYYQLRERLAFLSVGLEKRFSLHHNTFPDFGPYAAYEFSFATGKYDGSVTLKPEPETFHVPGAGMYLRFRNFGISTGYKYYNFRHSLKPPKNVLYLSLSAFIGSFNRNYKRFSL